jgi:hypothetical protein
VDVHLNMIVGWTRQAKEQMPEILQKGVVSEDSNELQNSRLRLYWSNALTGLAWRLT